MPEGKKNPSNIPRGIIKTQLKERLKIISKRKK